MNAKLTDRRRRFVTEYVQCWNASEAARRAGYKGRANSVGRIILSNVVIRAAVEAELRKHQMGADEVLARLATMGRGDTYNFIGKDGKIDLTSDEARAHSYLIKKIIQRPTKNGIRTELELHDPQAALVHIGRYWALFTDKLEHSGEVTMTWRERAIAELGEERGRLHIAEVNRLVALSPELEREIGDIAK